MTPHLGLKSSTVRTEQTRPGTKTRRARRAIYRAKFCGNHTTEETLMTDSKKPQVRPLELAGPRLKVDKGSRHSLRLLCVDPGTKESGIVVYLPNEERIENIDPHLWNDDLLAAIQRREYNADLMIMEWVSSYGMPVGKEVFETCRWVGMFQHAFGEAKTRLLKRKDIARGLTGSNKAKDSNVRRAVLDAFPATGGGKCPELGTKAQPGPLYGLTSHAIHALAVGLYWSEDNPLCEPWSVRAQRNARRKHPASIGFPIGAA